MVKPVSARQVAVVLDVPYASADASDEVLRRAEGDVGQPAAPHPWPDPFHGVEVGCVGRAERTASHSLGSDAGPCDRRAPGPPSSHACRHRCTDRRLTRSSLAISELASPRANRSAAWSRNSSRNCCRSAVSPPPCGYRLLLAIPQDPRAVSPYDSTSSTSVASLARFLAAPPQARHHIG